MTRVFAAILLLFASTIAAVAERRTALVFGENGYRTLRPLANAVGDAQAVAATLEKLGFTVTLETNRDLRRMRRALEDFREDASGSDVALVYYAGHGVEIAGDNRLLPIDADASSLGALQASTLPLEEVRDAVAVTGKVGLILLDACRNDPFGSSGGGGRSAVALSADVVKQARPGLGRTGRSENVLFAFSAAPGETAADGVGGHSPFAAALTKYLPTDGLEIRSVLTLVQQEVYDASRGAQLPYIESGLPKTFFAAATAEKLPERERLLLAMADVTPAIRDEVERIAAEKQMPLAPLYGALVTADLSGLPSADRSKKLAEAASAYVAVQDRLKTLASSDPGVERLRHAAQDNLSLGAFVEARSDLADAAAIDARSADTLSGNLVTRRLSEAATHLADAGVAKSQLDYHGAIAALELAATLHDRIENEQVPDTDRQARDFLLGDLGDLEVAVGDTGAALDAYKRMENAALKRAAANAGGDAERDLWLARARIGDIKIAQGDLTGGLEMYIASLATAARVAAAHPDSVNLQRDRIVLQQKIGTTRIAQGDLAGALAAHQMQLAVAERLVSASPDDPLRLSDLAASHATIGDLKRAQNDIEGALASYRASLEVSDRLTASSPSDLRWQRSVSLAHERIGDMQAARNNLTDALASYRLALDIREKVAKASPDNLSWQRDLAVSHQKIGELSMAQGDLAGARSAYEASLEISDRLARTDRNNADWQRDVAVGYLKIGDLDVVRSNLDGALSRFETSLALTERFVASDPSNSIWLIDLSSEQERIGNVKMAQRAFPEALASYQAYLSTVSRLAQLKAGYNDWQRGVSVAYRKVGDAKLAMGDPAGALDAFQSFHDAATDLVRFRPGSVDLKRDLLSSNDRIGDAKKALGDGRGAIQAYRAELAIAAEIAATDPTKPDWQRLVSISNGKIADVAVALGDLQGAIAAYQTSVVISDRLWRSDSANPERMLDLAIGQEKLAQAKAAQGDRVGAVQAYRASAVLLEQLAAANPRNPDRQRDLIRSHVNLASAGDNPGKHLRRALDLVDAMDRSGIMTQADLRMRPEVLRRLRAAGVAAR